MAKPNSLFGLTKTLVVKKIKKFPQEHLAAMRELSFGPDLGSMWRWTYHDGSTWAAVIYAGEPSPESIMAWACVTFQEEPYPVLGVYVAREFRGLGLADSALSAILREEVMCTYSQEAKQTDGNAVYAVSANYSRYPELLARFGFSHLEWA